MNLYAVSREGVYRHEILGIFKDLEIAKSLADNTLRRGDDYHSFNVLEFVLDKEVEDGIVVYSAYTPREMVAKEFRLIER